GVDAVRTLLVGRGVDFDDVVAAVTQVDERVGDEVDLVAGVPRVVAGCSVRPTGKEEVGEAGRLNAEERPRAIRPVVLQREAVTAANPHARARAGTDVEDG